MKKFIQNHQEGFYSFIGMSLLVLIVIGFLFGLFAIANERAEFDAWYNSLSAEEQAEYEAPYTTTYEVVAVEKYHVDITNRFGGVRGTYACYEFHYVDENGEIVTVHDHRDDWGSEDVVIGDTNTYVLNSRTDTRTLTLTMETFMSLSNPVSE